VLRDGSKLPGKHANVRLSLIFGHAGDARVVADSSRGIRSIRFSPDGQHMAVGDRAGNLK